ncbi:MAG: SPASM domain-containing protein [Lachnospiraceae bacterium]|nr:SPASM domain-containing protein [Lachnospiraceae bacterium]
MSIQINHFLGKFGRNMRKYFPRFSSSAYLALQFLTRRKEQKLYCDYFLNAAETPKPNVVNIETINRCNSTCAFCTANVHAEKRPLAKIDEDLYRSIIDQLADWGYEGHLTLYGNNEPWLDTKIVERHKYAREKLPDSFIFMSTNGLILTIDKVKEVAPYINQLIINNYSMEMKLHKNIQELYDYVKANPEEFKDLDIQIQMRYLQEVLTNRAGSAPNKKATEKVIKETCLLPFTDMWIMPNGKMGLCCCDNFETTDFGDLTKMSLKEAWGSPQFQAVRKKIAEGRQEYPFCKHCDFIDAGFRMQIVNAILRGDQEAANKLGGHERMKIGNKNNSDDNIK